MSEIKGMKSIKYASNSWTPYSGCLAIASDCAVKERKGKCWAEVMANRLKGRYGYDEKNPFKPTFHEDKLEIPIHWVKPRRIATCFMGDLAYAKREWVIKILQVIKKTPRHIYYILTKKPGGLLDYEFPKNAWVGVTVNKRIDLYRITILREIHSLIKFISIEPLYEDLKDFFVDRIDWIIIGAQTSPSLQPKRDWVENILKIADKHQVPVFMKENLKFEPKRYEFPPGVV